MQVSDIPVGLEQTILLQLQHGLHRQLADWPVSTELPTDPEPETIYTHAVRWQGESGGPEYVWRLTVTKAPA